MPTRKSIGLKKQPGRIPNSQKVKTKYKDMAKQDSKLIKLDN